MGQAGMCLQRIAFFSPWTMGNMRIALIRDSRRGAGAMKAFLATCIAGAIAFFGMIYLVGGNTRHVTVADVMPVAMPEVAANFAPAVPGRFAMPGFPDDRVAQPSHQDAAPDADAGAEKAAAPVLASVGPEPTAAPQITPAAEPVSLPAAVPGPSLTAVDAKVRVAEFFSTPRRSGSK